MEQLTREEIEMCQIAVGQIADRQHGDNLVRWNNLWDKLERMQREICLTKRVPDVCPADGGKHSWHPNEDNYLIYSCRKCGARG